MRLLPFTTFTFAFPAAFCAADSPMKPHPVNVAARKTPDSDAGVMLADSSGPSGAFCDFAIDTNAWFMSNGKLSIEHYVSNEVPTLEVMTADYKLIGTTVEFSNWDVSTTEYPQRDHLMQEALGWTFTWDGKGLQWITTPGTPSLDLERCWDFGSMCGHGIRLTFGGRTDESHKLILMITIVAKYVYTVDYELDGIAVKLSNWNVLDEVDPVLRATLVKKAKLWSMTFDGATLTMSNPSSAQRTAVLRRCFGSFIGAAKKCTRTDCVA